MHVIRSQRALLPALLIGILLLPAVVGCGSSGRTTRTFAPEAPLIEYTVSVPDPAKEEFQVSAVLRNIKGDTITFYFPIWGPGAYDVVNFGAYVRNFSATGGGTALTVLRGDTNTFRIISTGGDIQLRYMVDDIEFASNSLWFGLSDVEPDFAFANTPALFGYPAGYKEIPYTVTYQPPPGWDMTVGLEPLNDEESTYFAEDYDELVDCPVQMGSFQRYEFEYAGKPHIITMTAPVKLTEEQGADLVESTRKVVEAMTEFFGDVPYDQYIFQHYLAEPGGGDFSFGALEHRNSSTYRMPYLGGNSVASLKPVIAHEFWHTWSPKRIHVHELGPFDYQRAPRTTSLWFAEGITEYYARVFMMRTGMQSAGEFLSEMNQTVSATYGRPQSMPITELSRNISEMELMQAIGLYTKGPVLAFLLDGEIRWRTDNRMSLDDVMKEFNREYGRTGKSFGDEDIIPIMERITRIPLQEFFNRYIAGTEPIPYGDMLPKMGLTYGVDSVWTGPAFSAEFEDTNEGWRIVSVKPNGSADRMGLRAGDVVVKALTRSGSTFPLKQLAAAEADRLASIRFITTYEVKRGEETLKVKPDIVDGEIVSRALMIDPNADGKALKIRKSMIGM